MDVRAAGSAALLVEVGGPAAARELARWLRHRGVVCDDVVPGARTLLLDGLADPSAARAVLAEWVPASAPPAEGGRVDVPVRYDGPDLPEVARQWGMTVAEAVATHTGTTFTCAFCGFAPGFAYLEGLPPELAVPRLETPRAQVPAGSVALADRWCGVYPSASPGGWRLLGTTEAVLWDVERPEPALLPPGTRVRFVETR